MRQRVWKGRVKKVASFLQTYWVFFLTDAIVFSEPNGKELFTLTKSTCAVFNKFVATSPSGNELFTVKQKLNCQCLKAMGKFGAYTLVVAGSKVSVTFTNAFTEEPGVIDIEGCCSGAGVKLAFQGAPIAMIHGAASSCCDIVGKYDVSSPSRSIMPSLPFFEALLI